MKTQKLFQPMHRETLFHRRRYRLNSALSLAGKSGASVSFMSKPQLLFCRQARKSSLMGKDWPKISPPSERVVRRANARRSATISLESVQRPEADLTKPKTRSRAFFSQAGFRSPTAQEGGRHLKIEARPDCRSANSRR